MLKLGLVTAAQLARPRTLLGAQKFPSLLLLASPANSDVQRDDILRMLQMANGTWKDSRAGRLRVVDEALQGVLAETHAGGALRVLDLGVASGITSVELDAALRPSYASLELIATDQWRDAVAVRSSSGWTIVLDVRGNPLQYIVGRFVLPAQSKEAALYPVNRALRAWSESRWLETARAVLAAHDIDAISDFATVDAGEFALTRIPLLSASCLRRCADEDGFRFQTLDVVQPFPFQADVIRALNLLTPHHLPAPVLRAATANCLHALRPGGLFVVGRSPTDEPRDVAATIFRAETAGVKIVRQLNGGAEIESLVNELSTPE